MDVPLHFAERAFALHLLLQRLEGLIDVVVADENLNQGSLSYWSFGARPPNVPWPGAAASEQKENWSRRREAYRIERGEISDRAADVHGAREGFLLRVEVA